MKKLSANLSARFSARSSNSSKSQAAQYASIIIKFDQKQEDYYKPGEELNGIVELHVERKIFKVRGLKIKILGFAKCAWKNEKRIKFEGHETIFESNQFFFGKSHADPIELPTGIHLYKFSCELPVNATSSYIGTHGEISYNVVATLDIQAMKDVVSERVFTVQRFENLNNFPWMLRSIENEYDFRDSFSCCESHMLVMCVKVKKIGYALGEKIIVNIQADNQGEVAYDKTSLSLDRVETYHSSRPFSNTLKSRKIITYINLREIKPHETLSWEEEIYIPKQMPVTSDKLCNVLKITYELNLKAKPGEDSEACLVLPITIGKVGLTGENEKKLDEKAEVVKNFLDPKTAQDERPDTSSSIDDQSAPVVESLIVPQLQRMSKSASNYEVKSPLYARGAQASAKWTSR